MIWLLLLLQADAALPKEFVLVDTRVTASHGKAPWHLRVRIHPVGRRLVHPGEDEPSFVGAIHFEVWRAGRKHQHTWLRDIGGPTAFTIFGEQFEPEFQDLNHDGRPDFTICQRTGAYVSDCLILNIEDDATVTILPVVDSRPGYWWTTDGCFKIEELGPTSQLIEPTGDGFCYPTHWPAERTHCLRWLVPAQHFEPVGEGGSE